MGAEGVSVRDESELLRCVQEAARLRADRVDPDRAARKPANERVRVEADVLGVRWSGHRVEVGDDVRGALERLHGRALRLGKPLSVAGEVRLGGHDLHPDVLDREGVHTPQTGQHAALVFADDVVLSRTADRTPDLAGHEGDGIQGEREEPLLAAKGTRNGSVVVGAHLLDGEFEEEVGVHDLLPDHLFARAGEQGRAADDHAGGSDAGWRNERHRYLSLGVESEHDLCTQKPNRTMYQYLRVLSMNERVFLLSTHACNYQ